MVHTYSTATTYLPGLLYSTLRYTYSRYVTEGTASTKEADHPHPREIYFFRRFFSWSSEHLSTTTTTTTTATSIVCVCFSTRTTGFGSGSSVARFGNSPRLSFFFLFPAAVRLLVAGVPTFAHLPQRRRQQQPRETSGTGFHPVYREIGQSACRRRRRRRRLQLEPKDPTHHDPTTITTTTHRQPGDSQLDCE
ncbi:hypothetical protein EX30DRAFT_55648 [Ascodesmis nigricans]|uniref:Uncharacterized protein n=1 Tax=Ascodesmis nigricans TaxID=341454 RepID=A0A4S2MUP7_9PEZI|nr:hypothetical protein EX30DRAFT_55648 [Ascodesmis nigricans]